MVDKIFFAPPGSEKAIIKGIHFEIKQGELIGVIGPSGSGKTTLAKLLVGIWKPNSGIVRLDQADIYRWNRYDLGKNIGYLPQNIELFNGSVKTNIARMQDDADTDSIIQAAQLTNSHNMILHLPNAYETEIGIEGSSISSGQKQRIGLARAFFGTPKLIVLDEPNAHLDQEGEIALVHALNYAKKQAITTIIIAHRPSILSVVDKILVLHDGMLKMFEDKEKVFEQLKPPKINDNKS